MFRVGEAGNHTNDAGLDLCTLNTTHGACMKPKSLDVDQQSPDHVAPVVDRRSFIRGSLAGAAAISFSALLARRAGAVELPYSDDYGPVSPVNDLTTGLPLISLPAGFTYRSFGWRGQPMADGRVTPGAHDGMDVVAAKANQIALVRNHEQGSGLLGTGNTPNTFVAAAGYENKYGRGGTTNLLFDAVTGKWQSSYGSLSGTVTNCAGGRTPWGSWLTCEETGFTSLDGVRHGWIFEVPGYGLATGQPLTAMGRFSHEACAVDPATGVVYETEDATPGGFYKFVPNQYGKLAAGGTLYALKVVGQDDFSFIRTPVSAVGTTWDVEWVQVTDVEAINGRAYSSALGRAQFARPEGAYYDSGKIFWVCTSGGTAGQGQVFVYDPRRETLNLLFQSTGSGTGDTQCNNPDNIAVSPRGGVVVCEDGGNSIQRLRGVTQNGTTFIFAENNMNLSAADVAQADAALQANGALITHFPPGNYRGIEWAGACFHERWMFVNIQTPGVTFAITGPWDNGML